MTEQQWVELTIAAGAVIVPLIIAILFLKGDMKDDD